MAGAPPTGTDGPHVFVDDVERPRLDEGDRHHLERALRVRPGDTFTVSDGRGRWRLCRLGAAGPEPVGEVVEVAAPAPALTVAFALTKGQRPELTVQKLTELGLDRIVPFAAARSVVRWDADRSERHVERLGRVAREAAMQCRRVHLPEIAGVVDFPAAAAIPGAVLADRGGRALGAGDTAVLVGPEGGWDEGERACGLPAVDLGPHVLRAETAAIAAGTLLAALRAGLVHPS